VYIFLSLVEATPKKNSSEPPSKEGIVSIFVVGIKKKVLVPTISKLRG